MSKYKLKINDIDLISFATIPERLIKEKYLKFTLDNYEKVKIFFEEKSFNQIKFLNEFKQNFLHKYKYKNKILFFNHLYHLYASYYLSGFKTQFVYLLMVWEKLNQR